MVPGLPTRIVLVEWEVFWLKIELVHVMEDAFKQVDPCLPGKFVICLNEASICLLKV